MSLARYFEKKKIELFLYKIEFLIGIILKIISRWLINKTRLKKRLESGDRKRYAIIITVKNNIKTS